MIFDIGPHRVRHGDVMESLDELMGEDKAYLFYSDPPWGQSKLSYWQTINLKLNPEATRADYLHRDFLERLFRVAVCYTDGLVFIEYGVRWEDEVLNMGTAHGLHHQWTAVPWYRSSYGKLLPLHLHLFSTRRDTVAKPSDIDGTKGIQTLLAAAKPFAKSGEILLDPCCGLGYSARLAMETGMRFRGNEINRKRLEGTIEVLSGK